MFDEENPWSPWVGRNGFAHPDAPCRGGGYSPLPGSSLHNFGAPDPHSPAGLDISPEEAAEGYAQYELKCVIDSIDRAREEQDLFWAANAAFGSNNFNGRFGIAQRSSSNSRQFFGLQKLMVQAELHDRLTGRRSWPLGWFNSFGPCGPELWQVGYHLKHSVSAFLPGSDRLKHAAETRDALLKELTALFTKGDGVLAPIKAQLKPKTLEGWAEYGELVKQNADQSRGQAGWLLGLVMVDVLTVIAAQSAKAGFAASLAGVAPQLLKAALSLGDNRTGGAADDGAAPKPIFSDSTGPAPQPRTFVSSSPSRAVPVPTADERALAAQNNAAPDDGQNSARFAAREKVVRDFYEGRPGLGQERANQDLGCHPTTQEPNKHPAGYGIDLSQPVKVVNIPPPDEVDQYVKAHGNPGNFFDPIGGQTADHLGLNGDPNLRQPKTFSVAKTDPSQQALVSRNGPITDDWTDAANPVSTKGTGTQMTIDNTTKASLTPQPQPW